MIRALRDAGFAATGVFAPSLKVPGLAHGWPRICRGWRPS
jgi:hypothetical protein